MMREDQYSKGQYRDDEEDDDNVFDAEEDEYADEYEEADEPLPEQPPRREFKYSTADMDESKPWKKYCLIFLLFCAMILFMIGLSMLLQHFFFSDVSDNAPQYPERPENATFREDKQLIDQMCSRGTLATDNGERCRDACLPQFFECCDPFDEFDLYQIVNEKDEEDKNEKLRPNTTAAPTLAPTTTAYYQNQTRHLGNCSLDTELRGCMSYAKCQAVGKKIEPAPSTLPVLCNLHNLDLDPVSCKELCKETRCCYSDGKDNCLADNFDICMDYAPCQNLRSTYVLETAPDDLDQACFWQQPECNQICEKAKCCGDPKSSCLQDNFLSCLTYAPCTGVTRTEIVVAPQFSVVPNPPRELVAACEAKHELMDGNRLPAVDEFSTTSCHDLCVTAKCCWAGPEENCFFQDPLGCLAWEQQCQVLKES